MKTVFESWSLGTLHLKNRIIRSATHVAAARLIKRAVAIPVIVVGGIRNLPDITDIIVRKDLDRVSLARPFIIEPDIVEKFRQGRQDSSRCIDCGYCLIGSANHRLQCYDGRIPVQE